MDVRAKETEKGNPPQPDVSFMVGDKSVDLFHSSAFPDSPEKKEKNSLFGFLSFGKKKNSPWYYAVLTDHVMIRAGKLVLKSKIHSVEGFHFIRVPHIGILLVEKNSLRIPLSGEKAIISRKMAR